HRQRSRTVLDLDLGQERYLQRASHCTRLRTSSEIPFAFRGIGGRWRTRRISRLGRSYRESLCVDAGIAVRDGQQRRCAGTITVSLRRAVLWPNPTTARVLINRSTSWETLTGEAASN